MVSECRFDAFKSFYAYSSLNGRGGLQVEQNTSAQDTALIHLITREPIVLQDWMEEEI